LEIEFNLIAINTLNEKIFDLENFSRKDAVKFEIKSTIFDISPLTGVIKPKGKVPIKISITAKEAKLLSATTTIQINDEKPKLIKLSALGKYAFITCENKEINFNEIIVGKTSTKELIIKNNSCVRCKINIIESSSSDPNPVFSFNTYEKFIPAEHEFKLEITYTPSVVKLFSCQHFRIFTESGNSFEVQLSGQANGIDLDFSAKIIDFGEIKINQKRSKTIQIKNLSTVHS
jgi:hypothetical protein